MALKDHLSFLEEPLVYQNPYATMQDNRDDDSEETISLSDLLVYGRDTNYSATDSEDSTIGDESFEFFSEELVKQVKDSQIKESIVFCGNLILPKQPISRNTQEFNKQDHRSMEVDRNSGRNTMKAMNKGRNHGETNSTKRVLPALGSKKSRWYSYGVGLAGIPAEMDLSGIRSRQNRRQQNRSVRIQGGGEKEENGGSRHGKSLGRLIRDLSCSSQSQANGMVKASLVYIPRKSTKPKITEKPVEIVPLPQPTSTSSSSSLSSSQSAPLTMRKNDSFDNGVMSGASSSSQSDQGETDLLASDFSWPNWTPLFEMEVAGTIDAHDNHDLPLDTCDLLMSNDEESEMLEKLYCEYLNLLEDGDGEMSKGFVHHFRQKNMSECLWTRRHISQTLLSIILISSFAAPLKDQKPNSTMQDTLYDESEDTISLCDHPSYGHDTNYSKTDSEDSMIVDESFEFFSEEWVKKVKDSHVKENIIFCGNYFFPNNPSPETPKNSRKTIMEVDRNSIEFARLKAMNKGRNHGKNATKRALPSLGSKKSRWYFYGIGLAGIPAEMDLSGIRSRQNRRQQGGGEKEDIGGCRRHEKGLDRLIRDLSCNSQTQANNMVKASFVYIPRKRGGVKGDTDLGPINETTPSKNVKASYADLIFCTMYDDVSCNVVIFNYKIKRSEKAMIPKLQIISFDDMQIISFDDMQRFMGVTIGGILMHDRTKVILDFFAPSCLGMELMRNDENRRMISMNEQRNGMFKLRFKPAHNPYTEPRMDIFGYHEGFKKWVEVGNSGMFRPEMLLPMGVWDFLRMLEPTMILYGIDNIIDLFGHKVDLGLIKSNPICRIGLT
ncbi:hypothetical protein LXL04_022010 [Taraxacum kok-saghyz]